MEIKLASTPYAPHVQSLGDPPVFFASLGFAGFGGKWYTTMEEARQQSLHYFETLFLTYKRACDGRNYAIKAIEVLSGKGKQDENL